MNSPVPTADSFQQMYQILSSPAESSSPFLPANLNSPKQTRPPPLQSTDASPSSSSVQPDSERFIFNICFPFNQLNFLFLDSWYLPSATIRLVYLFFK